MNAVAGEKYSTTTEPAAWSLAAFLASPRSRSPEYLVNPLSPECSLTMLAAEPGAGKTIFTAALGLAVAQGEPFLGMPTKQGAVLFIGEDAPAWDYGSILRKLVNGQPAPGTFHVAAHQGFRLADSAWQARLGQYVERNHIRLIIIDTLRAVHGKNENDSGEMQEVMNALRAITVTYGVGIIFLHHTSKMNAAGIASEYRGSSVLLGSCDFFIHMSAEYGLPGSKVLTLRVLKGRTANLCREIRAVLTYDDQSAELSAMAGPSAEGASTVKDTVNAELAKGPVYVEDLLRRVPANGRSPKTVRGQIDKHLHSLEAAGLARARWYDGRKRWEAVSVPEKAAA